MTYIRTDWLGRAVYGSPMHGDYSASWHEAFPGCWERTELEPGCWMQDEHGRHWWVTDTPEWDRRWFRAQGVRPPKRFGDFEHSYFKDVGGGLSRATYDPQHTYSRHRGTPLAQKLGPGESVEFNVEPEEQP
jgi:hypothetical protein